MEITTIKDFEKYGLNKLDSSDSAYQEGERYQANYQSGLDGEYFRTKKEAINSFKEYKKLERKNKSKRG